MTSVSINRDVVQENLEWFGVQGGPGPEQDLNLCPSNISNFRVGTKPIIVGIFSFFSFPGVAWAIWNFFVFPGF